MYHKERSGQDIVDSRKKKILCRCRRAGFGQISVPFKLRFFGLVKKKKEIYFTSRSVHWP